MLRRAGLAILDVVDAYCLAHPVQIVLLGLVLCGVLATNGLVILNLIS